MNGNILISSFRPVSTTAWLDAIDKDITPTRKRLSMFVYNKVIHTGVGEVYSTSNNGDDNSADALLQLVAVGTTWRGWSC